MTLRLTEQEYRDLLAETGRSPVERSAAVSEFQATVERVESEGAAGWKEKEFKSKVMNLAHEHDCNIVHYRPARTEQGWRTPIEGDKGSPDLLIAHPFRGLVVAELKAGKHWKWQPGQREWLEACGWRGFWWHPHYWDEIRAWFADPLAKPHPHWFVGNWENRNSPGGLKDNRSI